MILCLLLAVSVFANPQQQYQGVWWWTWTSEVSGLGSQTNIAIAFSGWTDASTAKSSADLIVGQLPGTKFISLGGGNSNGYWTAALVSSTTSACNSRFFSGYNGIAFDIEEGDAGLDFSGAFAACKAAGYQVLVTSSHSAPYGVSDGARLMRTFFTDPNVDFLSPQLYTSGTEAGNDFTTSQGVNWNEYAGRSAKIIPSIVTGSYYGNAQSTFATYGVSTVGYIQWAQAMTYPSGSNPVPIAAPTSGSSGGTFQCGSATCPNPQCCSQWGYCGTGSSYCGAGCTGGSCTGGSPPVPKPVPVAPSTGVYCNGITCAPGLCCSQWGYCGSGAAYCDSGSRLASDAPSSPSGGLSSGALAAIIVCSVLVAVVIVGLALFFLLRKKDSDSTERV